MAAVDNIRRGHRADVTRRLGALQGILEDGDAAKLTAARSVLEEKLARLRVLGEPI